MFNSSHCRMCNHRVKFYDLIPVVSYLLLKGKCRVCKEKISIRYPLVELFTGILALLLYLKYGATFLWLKYTLLSCWAIVIGFIDLDTTDVYVKTTVSGIGIAIIFIIIGGFYGNDIWNYIIGGALGGGIIAIIILLTKGMGWGDAEVFLLGGLFIGLELTLVAMFFSFVLGAVFSVLFIVFHKKSRKDYIPFAPYISMALIISILFGDKILQIYLS